MKNKFIHKLLFFGMAPIALTITFVTIITIYNKRMIQECIQKIDAVQKIIFELESFSNDKHTLLTRAKKSDEFYLNPKKFEQSESNKIRNFTLLYKDFYLLHDHSQENPISTPEEFSKNILIPYVTLSKFTRTLGYKNWGLVGEWRASAHQIEKISKHLNDVKLQNSILTLRRNEKDYLLRNEPVYIDQVHSNIDKLVVISDSLPIVSDKILFKESLSTYNALFDKYVTLQALVTGPNGLSKQLQSAIETETNSLGRAAKALLEAQKTAQDKANIWMYSVLFISLTTSFILSITLAGRILKPIKYLEKNVDRLLTGELDIDDSHAPDEFKNLYREIADLNQKIVNQATVISETAQLKIAGELAGTISHEIKNRLTISKMYIQRLKSQMSPFINGNSKAQLSFDTAVSSVLKSNDKILRVTESLRKLSRNESNQDFKVFFLKDSISDIDPLLQIKCKEDGTILKIAPAGSLRIYGQETLISQVLLNLLANSFYAVRGQNKRLIEVAFQENDNQLEISITDSGPEISTPVKEKMFKENFTTKGAIDGTGLGLMLVKKIIDSHNGRISFDDSCSETRIILTLPMMSPGPKDNLEITS